MAQKYLDSNGLLYFWQKIKAKFVEDVSYDSTNKKITKTKNGTTSDIVTVATLKTDIGNATTSNTGLMTTTQVTKLSGIAAGAEVNVNADWNATSGDAQILNKPTIPANTSDLINDSDFVSDENYVHTDNNFTSTEKTKLAGIAAGAEVNVQADWSVTSTTSDAYIKNKPTIPTLQNVFGIVKVGTTNIEADTTRDTLTLVAGDNVTLTPDATNDKVTIGATDTTYSDVVAGGASGLMSGTDKTKLDGIEAGAEVNVVDNITSATSGGMRIVEIFEGSHIYDVISAEAKGVANGVCPLNASSKIDSTYLPSYVDDVIEAYPVSGATELSAGWLSTTSGGSALTPETGKIYVLMADSTSYSANSQFRWSGTTYVKLSDGGVSAITNSEIDTIVAA